MRHLHGTSIPAVLCFCLCLAVPVCSGPRSFVPVLFAPASTSAASLAGSPVRSGPAAWASSCDNGTCDAVVTDRRTVVTRATPKRARYLPLPLFRFHNNSRPVTLRDRAIYCDFSRLRSVLHPQFAFIAHTSAVLC